MSRQVKGPKPGELIRYIPESYHNRDAPEADRVVVWIKAPTERQKRELIVPGESTRIVIGRDGQPVLDNNGNIRLEYMEGVELERKHLAVERYVEKVENYDSNNGAPITNGIDLANHGETDFITEIGLLILSNLSLAIDEKKKEENVRDSLSGEIQASDGAVKNADNSNSTGLETVTGTATKGLHISYAEA